MQDVAKKSTDTSNWNFNGNRLILIAKEDSKRGIKTR